MEIRKVTKHGKSKAINLPHNITHKLNINLGDHVSVALTTDNKIIIQKVEPITQPSAQ